MKKRNINIIILILLIIGTFGSINIYAEEIELDREIEIIDFSQEEIEKSKAGESLKYKTYNLKEENVYKKIYNGLLNLDDEILITNFKGNVEEYKEIYSKVLKENPEIFYTRGASITYRPNDFINFKPVYSGTKNVIKEKIRSLDEKVEEIISTIISSNMSELEKELAIHDYIVSTTEYDRDNIISLDSYSSYGVLIENKAVCEGYAKTMKLLLNKVGIEAIVVSSEPMNHAWNIVKIDGKNYHVDATHNDPVPDVEGRVLYRYFNLPDKVMKETHNWDYNKYPKCIEDDFYNLFKDVSSGVYLNDYLYYSSNRYGEEYIKKINLKSLEEELITKERTNEIKVFGDWIYFPNYSNGEYLYKVRIDGTELIKLNNISSKNLILEGNRLYFTDANGEENFIELENEEVDKPIEENYEGYLKWKEMETNIKNKDWDIKFNQKIDIKSANKENVYIIDLYGNKIEEVKISVNEERNTINIKPKENYKNKINYLYVENIKSEKGNLLKDNIKMKFIIK